MSSAHYDTVDSVLLLLAEVRERAEGAARAAAADGAQSGLVEALETADRELLALHERLFDAVYLGGVVSAAPKPAQLELDAS